MLINMLKMGYQKDHLGNMKQMKEMNLVIQKKKKQAKNLESLRNI